MRLRSHILSPSVVRGILAVCAAVFVASAASTTLAAGVVGTGSAASCTDAALNAALAGGALVTFNCGPAAVTIDISAGTGTKTIATDTTVDGGGLITISGGHSVGVFSVNTGVKFMVQNLTIANGNSTSGYGGGILNRGTLTMTNCTLSGNSAPDGGGIINVGTVTMTNCTLSNNSASVDGGGIYNVIGGALTMTNCTVSGNSASSSVQLGGGEGGGIFSEDGTLTLTNCTLSNNSADSGGGAISNEGTLTMTNCTVSGNSAPIDEFFVSGGGGIYNGSTATLTNCTLSGNSGGGIYNAYTATFTNTIITASPIGPSCSTDHGYRVQSTGHNLDEDGSCGFGNIGDLSSLAAYLAPLGDYGGPTQTHALCTGPGMPHPDCAGVSPAIDAGDDAVTGAPLALTTDQRGRPRKAGLHVDIGAYEVSQAACTGDCDGKGRITVDELFTLLNIALGNAQPSTCPNGNPSGAEVDIALIIQAVNHALSGCPSSDLYVTAAGALNGDGSVANPYRRITDAVARARAERQTGGIPPQEEIRIHVAPGTYIGSFSASQLQNHPEYEVLPIILNVPKLTLGGSTVLVRDDGALPTGSEPESETIVEPDQSLHPRQSLFLVTRTADGAVGNGVTVEGFVLDGREGPAFNYPLYVDRVSDFRITNNVIQHGSFGVTTRLASGTIEGNLLTHNDESGGDVTGGSIANPATVFIHANRVTGNGLHGLMTLAVAATNALLRGSNELELQPLQRKFDRNNSDDLQNIYDTLAVTLSGNDISDYSIFGIRFFAVVPETELAICIGRMGYDTQDDTQPLTAVLTATVLGNTIAGNGMWGLGMEAGFPCRSDPRALVVTFAGSFEGNSFAGSGRPAALFDFTRANTTPSDLPTHGFTRASTYQVTDADGELAGFDYDNPLTDPLGGAVLNNTLTVNGVEVPHGTRITPQAAGIADGTP